MKATKRRKREPDPRREDAPQRQTQRSQPASSLDQRKVIIETLDAAAIAAVDLANATNDGELLAAARIVTAVLLHLCEADSRGGLAEPDAWARHRVNDHDFVVPVLSRTESKGVKLESRHALFTIIWDYEGTRQRRNEAAESLIRSVVHYLGQEAVTPPDLARGLAKQIRDIFPNLPGCSDTVERLADAIGRGIGVVDLDDVGRRIRATPFAERTEPILRPATTIPDYATEVVRIARRAYAAAGMPQEEAANMFKFLHLRDKRAR